MTNLLVLFIVLNILNVIIQTVKSICTVKCDKAVAALVNAIAYGLYTIVTIYMLCDLNLYLKAGIVALCNLVGVYVVKLVEEKSRKSKLWKVEATIKMENLPYIKALFKEGNIPHNYIEIGDSAIVNCYCATQEESSLVKQVLVDYNAKFFVSESKTL
jgi:uncharacterized protein YebE (UPF0316 family)